MIRIVRVLAPNPGVYTLEGTNTWIVGERSSVVVDPGPDNAHHLRSIQQEAGPIVAILVTHDHADHAPGAARLSAATGAPVYAHRPPEVGRRLKDGDEIRAGGTVVRAVHTPGHSPDHIVFFIAQAGALFTGDAVLGRGTSVIDPPEGDLAAYVGSLQKMLDLQPRVIYPGHGPAVFDAAAKLNEYIAHRAEREEQVLAALAAGKQTIDEMVGEIYAEYPPAVRQLAARSVLAHLRKLEAEGRVDRSRKAGAELYSVSEPRTCARCGRPIRGRSRLCGRCSLAVLQEEPGRSKD